MLKVEEVEKELEAPKPPREAPLPSPPEEISYKVLGITALLVGIMAGPIGTRFMLMLMDVRPIKYFKIKKHYFGPILTGISGRLRVDLTNRTLWSADCEFYIRAYAEGFKLLEKTISFTIPRRCILHIDYGWSIGILDILVRAFLSLFSAETCIRGYVKIGGLKRNYDVTETIPVE